MEPNASDLRDRLLPSSGPPLETVPVCPQPRRDADGLRLEGRNVSHLTEGVKALPTPVPPSLSRSSSVHEKFLIPSKLFFRNVFVLTYVVLFCIEGSRGIFIGTVFSFSRYLYTVDGANFLTTAQIVSLSTSLYSLGRISSSTWLGNLSDDHIFEKPVYIWCSWISIASCVVYCLSCDLHSVALFLLSRYILGFSTGCLSGVRGHLARVTSMKQRTTYMAIHGMTQYGALAIAPFFALGAAWIASVYSGSALEGCSPIVRLQAHQHPHSTAKCSWAVVTFAWVFNGYTAPGVILILFNLINVVLFCTMFTPASPDILENSNRVAVPPGMQGGTSPPVPANGNGNSTTVTGTGTGANRGDHWRLKSLPLTLASAASQTRLGPPVSSPGVSRSVSRSHVRPNSQSLLGAESSCCQATDPAGGILVLPPMPSLLGSRGGGAVLPSPSAAAAGVKVERNPAESLTPTKLLPGGSPVGSPLPEGDGPVIRVMSEVEEVEVAAGGMEGDGGGEEPVWGQGRPRGETIDATPHDLSRAAFSLRRQPYYLRLLRRVEPFKEMVLYGHPNNLDQDFDLLEGDTYASFPPTDQSGNGTFPDPSASRLTLRGAQTSEGGDLEGGQLREAVVREHERRQEVLKDWNKMVSRGVALYMFLNFSARGAVALIEAAGTALISEMWHIQDRMDQVMETSLLFGAMGVAGMFTFVVTIWLARRVHEALLLLISFAVFGLGAGVVGAAGNAGGNINTGQVVVGLTLIWTLAFPVKNTTLLSSLTKLAGKKAKKKFGNLMGWIGTFGSLGRVVVPLIYMVADEQRTFGFAMAACALCAVLLGVYMWALSGFKKTHAKDLIGVI
uniref:Uncharacterized protein n=1 Tax=Chromera velia CCMP2878 TaxID=1169474 RepID=A0A0G4GCH6_9ALVE|eukprot:Cvel_21287.t1-p1 / transcript=Cvel_21287.t1 / gene=Cvel_21287 / organism=Chromera_velia_CCMP2878 / gene_product=hypothetical protein / transcript_product=hypothetical protein / location=Cvel_scaffold1982:17345-19873(+) / protein_length=843 / sequence_SO=supercontig / SO=protein_coding / is_pseudo=false